MHHFMESMSCRVTSGWRYWNRRRMSSSAVRIQMAFCGHQWKQAMQDRQLSPMTARPLSMRILSIGQTEAQTPQPMQWSSDSMLRMLQGLSTGEGSGAGETK